MGQPLKTAMWPKGAALLRDFDRATRDPRATQATLLARLLRNNQRTQYGEEHRFSAISTPDAFARAVPVCTFNDLAPYVERMKKGEGNILTRDQPVRFNVTSGTTDKPKYVPVTRKGQAVVAETSYQWLYRAWRDHPSLLDQSILCISSAAVEGQTEAGLPYGSASGMMYESLPRRLHRSFTLPFALSAVKDYDLRYRVMVRIALESEVSLVVTPNPTTLLKLAETGIRLQEEIIRSIHDGVLFNLWPVSPSPEDSGILEAIQARLRPNPARAKRLESVIQAHGRLLPFACWKELQLVGCWLGGSVGYQADKLSGYFGRDVPPRDIGYLSSEGAITIPYEDDTPAGILALHNNYYEFSPVVEPFTTGTRTLRCDEIEDGKQYRIILTSWNGLYRYDIDDIIEVRGFYNRTPLVAFVRKGDDMVNITGEKVHVAQFLQAFRKLKVAHGLSVTQFRIVPNYKAVRHELLVQLGASVSSDILRDRVLPLIDQLLSESNIEYAAKRESGRLNPPCFHVMDASWADDASRCSVEFGQRDVQHKWRTVATRLSEVDARHVQHTVIIPKGSDD